MANFAKQQLMKYGWEEGKGLGKNENGITEPVKLATNQNKAGIGYDENKPWWESLYDKTARNIKIESHDQGFSFIAICNNGGAIHPESIRSIRNSWKKKSVDSSPNFLRACVEAENVLSQAGTHVIDQKLDETCNKTAHESILHQMEHNFTSSGKLERIAKQDRLFLNNNSLLSATQFDPARENSIIYRKTNVESNKNKCCNSGKKSVDSSPNDLQTFIKTENALLAQACTHVADQKLNEVYCNKMACKPSLHQVEYNFTSGKLEEVIVPKELFLGTNPMLSAALFNSTKENGMAYRKMNAELDVEESEQDIENTSMLQCLEDARDFVLCKSTKTRHRKKINKLVQQLSSCSLEVNSQKQDFMDRKLCQKMKKSKEKKNLKILSSLHNELISGTNQIRNCMAESSYAYRSRQLQTLLNKVKQKSIDKTLEIIPDLKLSGLKICEDEKDSIVHKMKQDPELENFIIVDDEADDPFIKEDPLVVIDVVTEIDVERGNLNCKAVFPSKTGRKSQESISKKVKTKDHLNCKIECKFDSIEGVVYPFQKRNIFQRLNNKIQKKKNQRRSKQIKKIAEKLRGEALANELNSVIKNLTTFGLTEEVNANSTKKRLILPTQNHHTPV